MSGPARDAPRGLRPTRAVVDLDALERNYGRIARALPVGCVPMPVVKADGYGHGAAVCARRLEKAGAPALAVAVVEEAAELRRAGVECEILVMGYLDSGQLPELVRHRLVANAHSLPLLLELEAFARARAVHLPIHLKLDTGMTRLGIPPPDLAEAAEVLLRARDVLGVEGAFQNFASADDTSSTQTASQLAEFARMLGALGERGIVPRTLHVANSAGTLLPPAWPDALPPPSRVRPGLALYTRFPGLPAPGFELEDVMSFVSVVDQVKRIAPGTRVGYGGTFVAEREALIAIVPAGYADGVPRALGGHGVVLVDGVRCPIAGRISMDLTAVDVTDLAAPPERGTEVVFFGTRQGVRLGVEEAAAAAGTVSWEILCGVGPRVPRVIVESGARCRVISRFLPGGDGASDEIP